MSMKRLAHGAAAPFHNLPRNKTALPLLLLLAALSVVFLSQYDRGLFYRSGYHDDTTSNYLAQAANISAEHNFTGLVFQSPNSDGTIYLHTYNRFPVGGRLLLMLAQRPFEDDLKAQILSARMISLFFFCGAAVMAYLSLCRLVSHRWTALAATWLAFSCSYCLYYSDVVMPEAMPDLFGVLLTFHGMVVFVQEGRFRQLLAKTCLALLLGWHVFALLLPFVTLGLASELARTRPGRLVPALLHSRHAGLGAAAFLFGLAVLSFNFATEYYALDGRRGLSELPTFQSMLRRTGLEESFNLRHAASTGWPHFLKQQFERISGMSLPFGVADYVSVIGGVPQAKLGAESIQPNIWGWKGVVLGMTVTCAALIGLLFVRHKILWASLVLLGFCWALPMRHSAAFHDFETVFYIGLPLFLFSQMLLFVRRWLGDRVAMVLPVAAVAIFVLSWFKMAGVGNDARAVAFHQDMLADFEAIRTITKGKTVTVPQCKFDIDLPRYTGANSSTAFYLAGSTILFSDYADCASFDMERIALADFVVSRERRESAGLLTPGNRRVFLYDRAAYFDAPAPP